MALHYFDASALIKYYVREPGSTWVRGLIDGIDERADSPANTALLADISVAEVASALSILYRVGRLRRSAWDGAFDSFIDDVHERYRLVSAGRDDFFEAAKLTQRHPLKAYDAVQLAVALRQNRALTMVGYALTFVSGDKTLLTAARAEGLATGNPFDHVSADDAV